MWVCPKCGREFKRNNQSHYCGEAPRTIEEYISQQEKPVQDFLLELHCVIGNALPDVKQRIAWSMPTYGEKDIIVQFYAHKTYVSLYVGDDAIEYFREALKEYTYKKSAVYLKYTQPLPEALITEMVKWCCNNL